MNKTTDGLLTICGAILFIAFVAFAVYVTYEVWHECRAKNSFFYCLKLVGR